MERDLDHDRIRLPIRRREPPHPHGHAWLILIRREDDAVLVRPRVIAEEVVHLRAAGGLDGLPALPGVDAPLREVHVGLLGKAAEAEGMDHGHDLAAVEEPLGPEHVSLSGPLILARLEAPIVGEAMGGEEAVGVRLSTTRSAAGRIKSMSGQPPRACPALWPGFSEGPNLRVDAVRPLDNPALFVFR